MISPKTDQTLEQNLEYFKKCHSTDLENDFEEFTEKLSS